VGSGVRSEEKVEINYMLIDVCAFATSPALREGVLFTV
jgi:hypothetical protein